VQKRHGNGAHAGLLQLCDRGVERVAIQRRHDGAGGVDPFPHADSVAARDERARAPDEQIVDFRAILTTDLEHVAKTFGRQQRDARQLQVDLAEERVGRDRAGVRD
jgi:hypothetical protein